jgi:protein-histidine N-methyltransferase
MHPSQLKTLSPAITYTPLIAGNSNISILRRDLYDARFQIISEETLSDGGTDENAMDVEIPTAKLPAEPSTVPLPGDPTPSGHDRLKDLEYIDAPSDVIPNVYEGGLKTWECSIDLVEYLSQAQGAPFRDRSILEVGCGTAMPSAFILRSLLDEEAPTTNNRTVLHLQDYNKSVLELVTIPNLLLAWCTQTCLSLNMMLNLFQTPPKLRPTIENHIHYPLQTLPPQPNCQ